MSTNNENIDFDAFLQRLSDSMKSGNLKSDYKALLLYCKDNGLSSYLLNVLIRTIKESEKKSQKPSAINDIFFVREESLNDSDNLHYQQFVSLKHKLETAEAALEDFRKTNYKLIFYRIVVALLGLIFFLFLIAICLDSSLKYYFIFFYDGFLDFYGIHF